MVLYVWNWPSGERMLQKISLKKALLYLLKEISGDWSWLKGCAFGFAGNCPWVAGYIDEKGDCSLTTHGSIEGGGGAKTNLPTQQSILCWFLAGWKWGRRSRELPQCCPFFHDMCFYNLCSLKWHNLDSTADNSAVLCLWNKGKLVLL